MRKYIAVKRTVYCNVKRNNRYIKPAQTLYHPKTPDEHKRRNARREKRNTKKGRDGKATPWPRQQSKHVWPGMEVMYRCSLCPCRRKKKEEVREKKAIRGRLQGHPENAHCNGQPTSVLQPASPSLLSTEEERRRSTGCGAVASGGLCGDGVDVREANVGAVEAVGLVDLGEAWVVIFDKGDINTLTRQVSIVPDIRKSKQGNKVIPSRGRRRERPARQPGL